MDFLMCCPGVFFSFPLQSISSHFIIIWLLFLFSRGWRRIFLFFFIFRARPCYFFLRHSKVLPPFSGGCFFFFFYGEKIFFYSSSFIFYLYFFKKRKRKSTKPTNKVCAICNNHNNTIFLCVCVLLLLLFCCPRFFYFSFDEITHWTARSYFGVWKEKKNSFRVDGVVVLTHLNGTQVDNRKI